MKAEDVRIGHIYETKLGDRWVPVRIVRAEYPAKGWTARVEGSLQEIWIGSGHRLRLVSGSRNA